jgi:hypothetical protein
MKKFTTAEIRDLLNQVYREEISFSRMVEIINERVDEKNEPQYKDGDFVVNEFDSILILKETRDGFVFDHAYLPTYGELVIDKVAGYGGIKRHATTEEKQRMIEALAERGKRWNAEKKCIEDIPKRKFKAGDKVKIKDGISSKTHMGVGPGFVNTMDKFIGKELTVKEYCSRGWVVFYGDEYEFSEDWLEPYEELKEGDLAIFWDHDKEFAIIKRYYRLNKGVEYRRHQDIQGLYWDNAIKFESKEQYEKLLKGEI